MHGYKSRAKLERARREMVMIRPRDISTYLLETTANVECSKTKKPTEAHKFGANFMVR